MKITTRLKLAALVPALMALVITPALFFSSKVVEEAQEKDRAAQRIMRGVNELNNFVRSYMMYHEERPRQQFQLEYERMTRRMASVQFKDEEQRQLLDSIRRNIELMRASFFRLISNYERHGSPGDAALLRETEERLAGQLLIRSRGVLSDASRLERLVDEEITRTQRRINALIFILLVATAVPLTIAAVRMMRSIAASLAALRKGTEIVGSGNLDHRIGMASHDEFGELSRSFDSMTERLKETTASRDELMMEVAERKRALEWLHESEENLKRHVSELAASNRELEAFSYSVSHDLRAPLRSLDGFSKALLEDYADKLDAEGRNYLERIIAAAQRMGQLIDDLLNLSRLTRVEMRRENVNLSGIAEKIAEGLKKANPERSARFIIAKGLSAYGDECLMQAVIENLLGNAWKFTEKTENACIEFGVMSQEIGEGAKKILVPNSQLVYYVRDNGAGFDKTYADKLFTPFQRLHNTKEFAGTGIGLATVKRIVNRHGGRVWIEGEPGKGAAVYFTL